MEKVEIKSAGFINGEYKVILSNDTELYYIQSLDMQKSIDGFGVLKLEIIMPEFNRVRKNDIQEAVIKEIKKELKPGGLLNK